MSKCVKPESLARRSAKVKTYLILSDVHVPYHSANCLRAVCDFARDLKPDGLVIAGDFLDLIEVSQHNAGSVAKQEGKRISNSFAEGNKVLDQIDAATGAKCKDKHFLPGNHENRLTRWIATGDNACFLGDESVSIPHRLGLVARCYKYGLDYPHGMVRLGHLRIIHGRWCSKYHAATHLDRFRCSIMYGHTHSPQVFNGPGWERQQVAIGIGHLADDDSEAMQYAPKPNSWRRGFGLVYLEPCGRFHARAIDFVEGVFWYGGRRYGTPERR